MVFEQMAEHLALSIFWFGILLFTIAFMLAGLAWSIERACYTFRIALAVSCYMAHGKEFRKWWREAKNRGAE